MCLAIVKPAGKTVPEEHLRNGFDGNPDSAGIAYADNGAIGTVKTFGIEKLIESYYEYEHLPMLIHFRLATHGAKDEKNCHPFVFNKGRLAAIHNGIINIQSTKDQSDTSMFIERVLEPVSKRMSLWHPSVKFLVEQSIGNYNKIAVMDGNGETMIFNESAGHWVDGVWYSNTGYKETSIYLAGWNSRRNWKNKKNFGALQRWDEEREELINQYVTAGYSMAEAIEQADVDLGEETWNRFDMLDKK